MSNPFNKQLILSFVLSSAGFLAVLMILLLLGVAEHIIILTAFILFILLVAAGSFIISRMGASLKRIFGAMETLRNGKPLEAEFHGQEDPMVQTLVSISNQIEQQQQELRNERLMRIRSVIDGQDQERQRLSRELHDGLGQSLIAIKLQLENAGSQGHSQMRASVDVAKDMIDQTIDEVRRVTNALMPAALNEFGLVTALRTRCEEMANNANLKVRFENSGSADRLENKSKTYLYRIAQEAISNIIKHSRATEFSVSISRSGEEVRLVVTDNGKGFIFDPVLFAHRNGLQNIRERVALLNGIFELNSTPGAGTTLLVIIPYITGNGKNPNHTGG